MIKEFSVNNVRVTIAYDGLYDLYRIKMNKVDRIVDFDSNHSIKLMKNRGRIKLFSISEDVRDKSRMIESLKSNVEFMSQIQEIVDMIQLFMRPASLDVSDIFGDGFITNDNPIMPDEVRLVWENEDRELSSKLTIISIF